MSGYGTPSVYKMNERKSKVWGTNDDIYLYCILICNWVEITSVKGWNHMFEWQLSFSMGIFKNSFIYSFWTWKIYVRNVICKLIYLEIYWQLAIFSLTSCASRTDMEFEMRKQLGMGNDLKEPKTQLKLWNWKTFFGGN